jgi:hypothetical protein
MFKKIFHYAVRFTVAPARAAQEMTKDPACPWAGLWWALLFLGAYSVTALVYHLLGHQPTATPFMVVPLDYWYLVQAFTTIPVGIAGFIAYAGLLHLLCRSSGGRGSFEATFSSQMFTLIIPCVVFMLLLELLVAPILFALGSDKPPWPAWVETLRVFVLPFAWMFGASALAAASIHWPRAFGGPARRRWGAFGKSFAFVVVSMIPTGMIMAVFIR